MQVQAKIGIRERFDPFYLLITSFSVCSLGNYAVMTILALYFVQDLQLAATQAGALLLFTSLSFRLSRLFIAPVVDRIPLRLAIVLALFLTSVGYVGLTTVRIPLLVILLLFIIGLGHSSTVLLVKLLVSQAQSTGNASDSQFSRYAALTTGVNIAAAVGSSIGGLLLVRWGAGGVFFVAASSYAIAGLLAFWIPVMEMRKSEQPINWILALRLTLKQPAIWRVMLFTVLAFFLYTQSYASLPIFISGALHRPELLSSTFALNAVLVVVGQLPISRLVLYLRIPLSQLVTLAFVAFAVGFALLSLFPGVVIIYVAVAFWTLAEMLMLPALDALVAEGALVEYRQAAFALDIITVAIGEGVGNLFGVSLGSALLQSGNFSQLYTILAFGALGAAVVTIFVAKRNESIVLRLLNGQSPIPTGQTQLLMVQPGLMEKGGMGQSLLMWLGAGSYHDDRSFLEAHPEIVAVSTRELDDFIEQQPDQAGREMLADRLKILRDIRGRVAGLVRMAYVNMYGGLTLELPKWLEEFRQQLTDVDNKEQSLDQTASWRMTRLREAIVRAKGERSLAPEIVAELQVLYAVAALEVRGTEQVEAVESAIASLQEALKVYTLAQYPYQHARTHVFLSLAFQSRSKGSRRANLEQALASYDAATEGYQSEPFPMQMEATRLTRDNSFSQPMIDEKIAELKQAIARCQVALQEAMQQEKEAFDPDKTLRVMRKPVDPDMTIRVIRKEVDPDMTIRIARSRKRANVSTHAEWIAAEATQRGLSKD